MLNAQKIILLLVTLLILSSCSTLPKPKAMSAETVQIPYIKNSANECYYLDEFMPLPDSLVSGRSGTLRLRYYTYRSAMYKDLHEKHIILSFYSSDEACWSLFEEYYISD